MSIPEVSSEIYSEYKYTTSEPPTVDKNSKTRNNIYVIVTLHTDILL